MNDFSTRPSLVIFGIDAGDPRLLRKWADEGHLPALASIMQRGCWTRTTGPELTLEHGVWHSIFSGLSRGQHGCYYLRQLEAGSYDIKVIHGSDVEAPPFWAKLRDERRRVVAVDLPDVPPVRGVPGAQVGNWGVHRGWLPEVAAEEPCSEPIGLLEELTRKFGPPAPIVEVPNANHERNRQILRDLLRRVEQKGALCRYLLEQEQPEVAAICFGDSHTAGHQFWPYRAEASDDNANGSEFSGALREVYQAIDREIGLILDRLPETANVFIISSVGLSDHFPTGELLNAFCRQLGYQVPPITNRLSLGPMALARRLVPESWRIAMSRHFSRETRERLLAQQFRNGIDWQRTTAFALPSFYTGFLRINLRGREPQGIVEPGTEYEAVLQRLESDLAQLIDPQTKEPAIDHVVRCGEIFGANPPTVLPDLIVHWKSCRHFVDRVVHPKAELRQEKPDFFRSTDHIEHGFIAAAGPAIYGRGQVTEVDPLDLAPTFLALLDEIPPAEMSGRMIGDFCRRQ